MPIGGHVDPRAGLATTGPHHLEAVELTQLVLDLVPIESQPRRKVHVNEVGHRHPANPAQSFPHRPIFLDTEAEVRRE